MARTTLAPDSPALTSLAATLSAPTSWVSESCSGSLLLALVLSGVSTASAQELSPRLFQADTAAATQPTVQPVDNTSRRDFRWLGTGIGAVGLGLAAGLEAAAYCGNSENGPRDCTGLTIGVGLAGAAVGGAVGHLVGRAIHR